MISVEEAKRLVFSQIKKSEAVTIDLSESPGYVLAEDIYSPLDLPSFNQSAMDGYAFASGDEQKKKFEIVGEIKAGDTNTFNIQPGQAVRIFTGAEVPAGADTIVIQEKSELMNGSVLFNTGYKKGDCIRFRGTQIKRNELALSEGMILNPAAIGFLASLGISKVSVYKTPDVSVIVTGNELIQPGNNLQTGKVFESNSFSLNAALHQMHIIPKNNFTASDDINDLKIKIKNCLDNSDILILTGGISVGDYDLVSETLKEIKVETIFYKVAQKPGKPFYFGKINNKLIFALPGNPAAVLVCFYEYIFPAIRMMKGFEKASLQENKLTLLKSISIKEDRACFIRGKIMDNGIIPLEKQDSNMLRSFAEADALIFIPSDHKEIKPGEEVEVHVLPFN
jgi:molybdopterin molybdotransferase